jgi:spore maturation protein CgeB
LVQWLVDRRVQVQVWGLDWENFRKRRLSFNPKRWGSGDRLPKIPGHLIGGVLSDEDLVRTFNRIKVNLGFAACWIDQNSQERITQVRLRDFEVPMSGGFYLTEYQEELEEFFDIGSEIVCYRSKEDLLEKIRFYVKRPDLRNQIREAGRRRCLSDHTWERRFEVVFKAMGLKA